MASPSDVNAQPPLPDRSEENVLLSLGYLDKITENEHVLVPASLVATTHLLIPPYLSGAIRRNPGRSSEDTFTAAISLSFPTSSSINDMSCLMALEVVESKVQRIADELFDANIETTAGLRYVCLSPTTKIFPSPYLTLRGGRLQAPSPLFGFELSQAIATSPMYLAEAKHKFDHTDYISMVIPQQTHDCAVIFVSLGLLEACRIRDRLYD